MTRLLLAALAALLLAACQGLGPSSSPETFGEAVRRNVEVQLVNPAAPVEADPQAFDGDRAALAIGRYKANEVEEPEELGTTDVGGGGE